jgi:hypothetical protein
MHSTLPIVCHQKQAARCVTSDSFRIAAYASSAGRSPLCDVRSSHSNQVLTSLIFVSCASGSVLAAPHVDERVHCLKKRSCGCPNPILSFSVIPNWLRGARSCKADGKRAVACLPPLDDIMRPTSALVAREGTISPSPRSRLNVLGTLCRGSTGTVRSPAVRKGLVQRHPSLLCSATQVKGCACDGTHISDFCLLSGSAWL